MVYASILVAPSYPRSHNARYIMPRRFVQYVALAKLYSNGLWRPGWVTGAPGHNVYRYRSRREHCEKSLKLYQNRILWKELEIVSVQIYEYLIIRPFCQRPYMVTSSNGSIFRVTGLLCGKGHRWIRRTKVRDAELWCFLWFAPQQTVEKIIKTPVIWYAIAPIMTMSL